MQPYIRTRKAQETRSLWIGIILTAGLHAAVLAVCGFTGLHYLYPPPPETTFLLDFSEDEEDMVKPEEARTGRQPQAEEVDRTRPVELVRQAESPYAGERPNKTPATKPDPHGDVEVPVPEKQEPKLDPRASFPGMSSEPSSSTAPHSAKEASEGFKAGEPDGNTKKGLTTGAPNAHLSGRSVIGTLQKPGYQSQTEGTVVVAIKVDPYGNVLEAVPGAQGTTVTDSALWTAARNAALKAHFSQKADAPAVQLGTITYVFKLTAN
jgi:hypothetical protein